MKKRAVLLFAVLGIIMMMIAGCTGSAERQIDPRGFYYSKDEVALFIHLYDALPGNYITKEEARKLGWQGGSVERYMRGAAIGGDRYRNYEKKLPENRYWECDIDTLGKKSRGDKRLIYSDDGAIYYTDDHYRTFEQLY